MPFTIERNDLASVEADAIVVAANEQLQITGGVGLVVAQAAGADRLQAACDEIGYCPCGSAVATPAFDLPASIVVHAVGPIWRGGAHDEAKLLMQTYAAALSCAVQEGARSIALPLISAGTYGFPPDVSLSVSREAIRTFLNDHDVLVRLVLYSRQSVAAGMEAYLDIAEYIDDNYVEVHAAWGTNASFASAAAHARPSQYESLDHSEAPSPRGRRQGLGSILGDAVDSLREKLVGREREAERVTGPDERLLQDAEGAFFDATVPGSLAQDEGVFADASMASAGSLKPMSPAETASKPMAASLPDLLDSLDEPFSTTLLALVDARGMTDAQVYKRANMSRQLFSKIRSNAEYRPTKKTAIALAVALGLDVDETRDLLARAGYALSASSKADVIVEYFISHGNYDIFEINEALYAFDQPLL
ncbi:MAG: macro domain-containing protein [Eggerthellaceae bacterium]|nr:macro domain-containing protein [Eggerthellaceae bacterium]